MKLFNPFAFLSLPSRIILIAVLLASGCTTMPTTVGFNEDDSEYFSDDSGVYSATAEEMNVATKTDAEMDEGEEKAEDARYRETYSSSKGYWRAAVKYLQEGNEDDARWALEKSLVLNPENKVAKTLMYQLDVDAINELGGTYFEYKVQYGDSLSKLSKLYLHDSLKFYLLAKYNEIENPGRLVVGQVIHIPGERQAFEIRVAPNAPTEKSQEVASARQQNPIVIVDKTPGSALLSDAREMLAAGENLATIELIESDTSALESNAELRQVLVAAYYNKAKQLLEKKDFVESKLLLARAIELEPDNTNVNMLLIDMNEVDQMDAVYKKSLKALAENDLLKAHSLIKQVIAMNPNYPQVIVKKQEIEKRLSAHYYKQALMAQRKHELDTAIDYWDEVLLFDSKNDNAKLYRAKAVDLKMKLEKFVSTR